MITAFKAGVTYAAVVFALGFLAGTIRVLAVAPSIGEACAVAIELPLMLIASWLVCRRIVRASSLGRPAHLRAAMGASAFVLLMLAEVGLSVLVFGRTVSQHFAAYRELSGQLGIAGQLAFACLPLLPMPVDPTD